MKSKAFVCVMVMLFVDMQVCGGESNELDHRRFEALDSRSQEYIIKVLSKEIVSSDIGILHARSDEWLRCDRYLDYRIRAILGLLRFRLVAVLRGASSIAPYDLVYFYYPQSYAPGMLKAYMGRPKKEEDYPPPYFESLSQGDELMRLVFMRQQTNILSERILKGYRDRPRMKEVVEDVLRMDETSFLEKYNITSVFAERVYQLSDGCVFRIDHPAPEMTETQAMQLNRANLNLSEARVPDLQKLSRLVYLTNHEVSEIVFVAYLQEGEEGVRKYADASKSHSILLPMTEPVFETEIGRRLFDAVSKKAGIAKGGYLSAPTSDVEDGSQSSAEEKE